jgi:hypothetical protein
MPGTTPPASDLWPIPGWAVLSTTGYPIAAAAASAPARVLASRTWVAGIPYSPSSRNSRAPATSPRSMAGRHRRRRAVATGGGGGGSGGRDAWLSRWRRAASPLRVPSSTGMPPPRSSAATPGSIAAGRPASTTSGLPVRAEAPVTARG